MSAELPNSFFHAEQPEPPCSRRREPAAVVSYGKAHSAGVPLQRHLDLARLGVAHAILQRLLDNSAQLTLAQALEAEAQAQIVNFGTKDTAEALLAFSERREPRFEGA